MNKPFIIAEVSANHLGSLDRALAIVNEAIIAGADAVKFQTFTPEQMVDADKVIESGPWAGRKAIELYREARTPREWHKPLFDFARGEGLVAFSSVFHPDDVDFLETLGCPLYKIASFELTDLALIRHAAKTGKPLIMSTGMATLDEIAGALIAAEEVHAPPYNAAPGAGNWMRGRWKPNITLLKCTSAYPADASDANLSTMVALRDQCGTINIGLSDHTPGIGVAVAATALGATVIEKHLTLSRSDGGPDAAFSMEPHEFAQMVTECRRAAAAIGEVRYGPTASEAPSLALRRASGGKRGQK